MIQTHRYTAFQEAFQEDFKYSDFFQDQASQCIGDVRREFIFSGLEMGLERQFESKSAMTSTTRASKQGYENSEHY